MMRALIDELYGVWKFSRPGDFMVKARSTPGHLIHYVVSGRYSLVTDNRQYELEAGDLVYYFESEEVSWQGRGVPVVFCSIGFNGRNLDPPDIGSRVLKNRLELEYLFADALKLYHEPPAIVRQLKLFGIVSEIASEFFQAAGVAVAQEPSLWWQLENNLKRKRLFNPRLSDLCEMAGYSRATVIRACKKSTGETPANRLRHLRLEEAKGLLTYSMLSITDISALLGYGRVHEFSRDFSKFIGMPPTTYRNRLTGE